LAFGKKTIGQQYFLEIAQRGSILVRVEEEMKLLNHLLKAFSVLILSTQLSTCLRMPTGPRKDAATQNLLQVDSDTVHIQSVVAGSRRIQKIITEAKTGTKYRISFVASSGESAKIYQGYTTPDEGEDKNGITIHIAPGLSDQLTELLLAHELFHIVLQKRGTPSQVHFLLPQSALSGSYKGFKACRWF